MTLWLLAIVLWGFAASVGARQGAIRMAISLLGVLVAAAVSFKFDGVVRAFLPVVGVQHPVWYWFLPPIVVFLTVALLFAAVAQAVHHKSEVFYKYKAREEARLAWDRLNDRLGLAVGLIAGTVYLLVVCQVAVVGGYFAAQLKSAGELPLALRWMNAVREDAQNSGLSRLLGALDPTPASVYDAADTLGLIQHNPDLLPRLGSYPFFLGLAERPEFQDIAGDGELQKALRQPGELQTVLTNSKVQVVMKSEEILKHLRQFEPKDLLGFLQTGASAKYTEKILGRWELDVPATVAEFRRKNPQATQTEARKVQDGLAAQFTGLSLAATTEEQVFVKGRLAELPSIALILNPRAAVLQPRGRGARPAQPAPPTNFRTIYQGAWKKDGNQYQLSLAGDTGEHSATATAEDGRLAVLVGGHTLVFSRP